VRVFAANGIVAVVDVPLIPSVIDVKAAPAVEPCITVVPVSPVSQVFAVNDAVPVIAEIFVPCPAKERVFEAESVTLIHATPPINDVLVTS